MADTTEPIAPGTLVLLVGPAGAGKSTWASARFPASAILSSDGFRAMVSDDPADQDANADAFRLLHAAGRARLKRGRTTVIDATNLTDGGRRPLLALAARFSRPVVACVLDPPLEVVLARNAGRQGRVVPDGVIRMHHAQVPSAVAALERAGAEVRWIEGRRRP